MHSGDHVTFKLNEMIFTYIAHAHTMAFIRRLCKFLYKMFLKSTFNIFLIAQFSKFWLQVNSKGSNHESL